MESAVSAVDIINSQSIKLQVCVGWSYFPSERVGQALREGVNYQPSLS